VRSEFLVTLARKKNIFSDVTPCILVEVYRGVSASIFSDVTPCILVEVHRGVSASIFSVEEKAEQATGKEQAD
jgi:hypothetical protein